MERSKLVSYMVREFTGHNINVAVLASHSKICLIECEQGNIIIDGSANLSSSNNVEQFRISHDDKLFKSVKRMLDGILKKYTILHGSSGKTIFENNKENTGTKAFKSVKEEFENGIREQLEQQERQEPELLQQGQEPPEGV